MLPQDIIDKTVKAFNVSATSASGYGDQGVPIGPLHRAGKRSGLHRDRRHETSTATANAARSTVVTGPTLVRFDLSTVKRVAIKDT